VYKYENVGLGEEIKTLLSVMPDQWRSKIISSDEILLKALQQ
jgi:hypothetical protein